jgi:hypothetical protein
VSAAAVSLQEARRSFAACLVGLSVVRNDPGTVAMNTVGGGWELGSGGQQMQGDTTVRDG